MSWPPGSSPVELSVSAEDAQVSLVRTVAAAVASRLDFTVEEIADLRVVVSEACALLLECAGTASRLHVSLSPAGDPPGALRAVLSLSDAASTTLDEESFAWQVLTALAPDVVKGDEGAGVTLTLTAHGSVPA